MFNSAPGLDAELAYRREVLMAAGHRGPRTPRRPWFRGWRRTR